ncbi:MAG: hypothetical protein HC769_08240 [Cyanobacteria bacterium CRU_2_1]|nr:hypothetical protein [Cyanobacteria bacterium CRU_2_1]
MNQYVTTNPELFAQLQPGSYPRILRGQEGKWRLTFAERQRILLDHIYGVDIDPERSR